MVVNIDWFRYRLKCIGCSFMCGFFLDGLGGYYVYIFRLIVLVVVGLIIIG